MSMTKDEDKILKLLNKAERTDNEHEREAFMEMAERLMLKMGIDRAVLDAKAGARGEQTADKVIVRREPVVGSYKRGKVRLAHSITLGLGNVRYFVGKASTVHTFVGHESDIEDAWRLYVSLESQAMLGMARWWKSEGQHAWYAKPNDATIARREFIIAFGRGVKSQLDEVRAAVIKEESTPGTALVLVDRTAKVDHYIEQSFGKIGKGSSVRSGSGSARTAGYTAGREASTRKAVR